jgi:phospholipase C
MRISWVLVPVLLALPACSSSSDSDNGGSGGEVQCAVLPATPDLDAKRTACGFDAGAKVAATIGFTAAMRKKLPIDHVIVLMKENRSFDHIFGEISKAGQPDAEPVPSDFSNPDPGGTPVARYHETNTCLDADPNHQWDAMHNQVDGGKMDGFVKSAAATTTGTEGQDGHFVMGYFDQNDLPFYYFLGTTFALADRYFPSALTGTWPNRDYLMAATSDGVKETLGNPPFPNVPTIFDSLDTAKVSWGIYSDGLPLEGALGITNPAKQTMQEFYDAVSGGTLPAVSFVDGQGNTADDHPPADMHVSEDWAYQVYDAVSKSSFWKSTVIFYTYDEAGGFADHVPPPEACVARPQDSEFHELGIRVPAVVVSPWAKRNVVSHLEHQHTSITRFIELLYNLPAMTARDANSDAMLDMFDFCSEPAQIPDAPKAGTGGCSN